VGSYLGLKQADKNSKREDDRRRTERRLQYLEGRREYLAKEFGGVAESLLQSEIDLHETMTIIAKCCYRFPNGVREAFEKYIAEATPIVHRREFNEDKFTKDKFTKDETEAIQGRVFFIHAAMQTELAKIEKEIDKLTSTKHVPSPTNSTTV
jgi:hypothetical protein